MRSPRSNVLALALAPAFALSLPIAARAAGPAAAPGEDPHKGSFTLPEALKGIPGPANGPLTATIETTKGKLTCELYDKQTPITVANFVGLATGKRAWKDPKSGKWVKKPFYNGLTFHRVIPGFMIQGGDPLGNGTGNPGYKFADEIVPDLKFDKPGQLAMANAGPVTNGSQFFITDASDHPPGYLNGRHTIFGQCEPISVVSEIANVKRGDADKPVEDVVIQKVTIAHAKPPKAAPAPKAGAAAKGGEAEKKPAPAAAPAPAPAPAKTP